MDAFLAHAIVDPGADAGGDRPEIRAARALGIQLLGLVGERPLARTWRARKQDGEQVALVVAADNATDPDRARFRAAAAARVAAGVLAGAQIVHAVSPAGDAFVADLWTTGCATDLPALNWSPSRRLEFVRQVVRALEVLHAAGLVHGCLAADNVLLKDDLDPVLSEIGMVSVAELLARKGDASSYAAFAAPEVKRGEAPAVQADVWSVGHLLDQLVTPSEIPAVADLTRRCCAHLPRLRYATAAELGSAIDAVLVTLPKEGTSSPSGPRRGPPAGERVSRTGLPSAADANRERHSRAGDAPRERISRVGDAPRPARARTPILSLPARWPALLGVVAFILAMAAAFVLGAETPQSRDLLAGLVVVGVAAMAWFVPISHPRARLVRAGVVAAFAGVTALLDPVSWALRAGALRRLHGSEIARRTAVSELFDQGRDLHGLKLAGFDLSDLDLTGADLRRADLSHADLSGARLSSAKLEGAVLDGARLGRANLEGTALGDARRVETAECDRDTRLPAGWACRNGQLASQ